MKTLIINTVYENHRKSLITFWANKNSLKMLKMKFLKKWLAVNPIVLPDRSILIERKLVENAKNENETFLIILNNVDQVA